MVQDFIVAYGYTKAWLHLKEQVVFGRTLTYEILDVISPAHPRVKLNSGVKWLMWDDPPRIIDAFLMGYEWCLKKVEYETWVTAMADKVIISYKFCEGFASPIDVDSGDGLFVFYPH